MQQRNKGANGNAAMLGAGRGMVAQQPYMNGVMAKNMQNRNMYVSLDPLTGFGHCSNLTLVRTPQGMSMQGKMMVQPMQRDGSSMDINGQRPQTPGDNAPSPSKRQRLDNGGFDAQGMVNRQVSGAQQPGSMAANGAQMLANGQMQFPAAMKIEVRYHIVGMELF